jgi:lipoic acid synthetase
VDAEEPRHVAEAAAEMGLRHVVVTSVDRDELLDKGAGQFVKTIHALRERLPLATIEVLTPDFRGRLFAIDMVTEARPDIFNHNLETVPRLYRRARLGADYGWSLMLLQRVSRAGLSVTKSGIMVGLGETEEEVLQTMRDIRAAGCQVLTIGQYLQPTRAHLPVEEYVHPDRFAEYERAGLAMGFDYVASGPFVRSSFNAEATYLALKERLAEGRGIALGAGTPAAS